MTQVDTELVTDLVWPIGSERAVYAFEEFALRHGDFAIAAVAAAAELAEDGTIAELALGIGGVEDRPVKVETGPYLGAAADDEAVADIAETAAGGVEPMSDAQADAAYRRQLVRVLSRRALSQAFAGSA